MKIACVLGFLACAAAFGGAGQQDTTCVFDSFLRSPILRYTPDGSMASMFGLMARGDTVQDQLDAIFNTASTLLADQDMTTDDIVMVKVLLTDRGHMAAAAASVVATLGFHPAMTFYMAANVCDAHVQVHINAAQGEKTFFTNGVKVNGVAFVGALGEQSAMEMGYATSQAMGMINTTLSEIDMDFSNLVRVRGSIEACKPEICKNVSDLSDEQVNLLRQLNYAYNQALAGYQLPVMDTPFVALNDLDGMGGPLEGTHALLQMATIAVDSPRSDLPGTNMAPTTAKATNHPDFLLPYSFMGGTQDGNLVWIAGFHDTTDSTFNMTTQAINSIDQMSDSLTQIGMSLGNLVQVEISVSVEGSTMIDELLVVWNDKFAEVADPPSMAIEVVSNLGGEMLVGFLSVAATHYGSGGLELPRVTNLMANLPCDPHRRYPLRHPMCDHD